jgi:hypothetical protein
MSQDRLKQLWQMGKHDLQSYIGMAAPEEFTEEALYDVERAVLAHMRQRLDATPPEFLTAPNDFYFFMRKVFQHAEGHLWKQAWRRTEMSPSIQCDLQRVLDSWLDAPGQVEEEILRETGDVLDNYRVGGESYAIPAPKILLIAKAVRRSLLKHAERHGVREQFNQMPPDPTPDEWR